MSRLFLSGGASGAIDRLFEASIPESGKVLFIPVAMPEKVCSYSARFEWISDLFPDLQFDMWTDLTGRTLTEIMKYGAVYTAGGNPYLLMQQFRAAEFDQLLPEYYRQDGIIYGSSAGAIILGKDIRSSSYGGDADKNEVELEEFSGLNLLKNYSIQCHYVTENDNDLKFCAAKYDINIIALPDSTGLVVENDRIKIKGESNAAVFTSSSKLIFSIGSIL